MFKLNTQKRESGKKLESLRSEGILPAVFYGAKTEATVISINLKDFIKIWNEAGESAMVSLSVDGSNVDVLIQDVALDPVSDTPIHVDFYVVDKTKKVSVSVPVEFTGESLAVKNLGGTLVKVVHELEVEGLPSSLPSNVEIDISTLTDLDSTIAIKDLKLPDGVFVTADPDETVASIAVQKEEEEDTEAPDLASIEVEKKGKEETEGDSGGDGDKK